MVFTGVTTHVAAAEQAVVQSWKLLSLLLLVLQGESEKPLH
jgi:hypothetical protein